MTHSLTTAKRGYDVIRDPLLNKGTAFSARERSELELEGLLPTTQNSMEMQAQRVYAALRKLPTPLEQYVSFAALQDRNETLFYRVLLDHIEALMPIVYTPTVGLATQNFSHVFQRGRGLWLSPDMRGNLAAVLRRAVGEREIQLTVTTDSESILGIGDQGAGGMAISVGKLALYVAGAGIAPGATLPVALDVGTNNEQLLNDDLYLGWPQPRLTGSAYDDFIDEYVDAVKSVIPNALLQWEDFRKDNALAILDRHRDGVLSFNDDIQGTGAVALAGVLSALRVTDSALAEQRILVHGAGAAGLGISRQIATALRLDGVTHAHERIAVLDSRGLLVDDQTFRDAYKAELAWPASQAAQYGLSDVNQRGLADVVTRFQPTVLIGSSGQAGAFSNEVVTAMLDYCERPIILPFSNPTDYAEANPADLISWTEGRALVATGSPFGPVPHGGGEIKIGQGNNVFIFPGLGLGALLAQSSVITDDMVSAAADALAGAVTAEELASGLLFPEVTRLREVSTQVAIAVARCAVESGLSNANIDALGATLTDTLWSPTYPDLYAG